MIGLTLIIIVVIIIVTNLTVAHTLEQDVREYEETQECP